MFGIFETPEERMKRKHKSIIRRINDVYMRKKLEFRQNLINKMNFLSPNMVFMMNSQSDVFFGYDSSTETFVYGKFYDSLLGDLFKLEQMIGNTCFESHAQYFIEEMQPENIQRKSRDSLDCFYLDQTVDENGYCIGSDHPPTEIRIKKNGIWIARSGPFSPKHKGYFKEALYANVIEDIGGKGTSSIEVSFGIWNGGEINHLNVFYIYEDHPRAQVGPDIKHHSSVCSLFTPLLEQIEQDILFKNINGAGYLEIGWTGDAEEIDDTLLGLPANPRSLQIHVD